MNKKEYLAIGGLIAFVLSVGVMASSVRVSADNTDAIDEVSISIPASCTMNGVIATGHEHTASINPNTYEDDIGETTITTTCNDSGGYAIYAIGFTGDKYTGEDHTKLIGSSTGSKISTGTGTSGNSQWAMRVTAVTGTYAPTIVNSFDSSSYHVVPDTYAKVATFNSATDVGAGATGGSIKTTYAAYISGTQAADTYTGKVKYTLVHPNTETPLQPQVTQSGKICYYPNGGDVVGTMGCQTVSTGATSATLLASNFSREGYGFAGWNTEFDYSGTFYGPNETISFTAGQYTGTNPGLSLYAVWVKSQGNLQDSTKVASVCNSLDPAPTDGTANLASVSALTDQRDNNTYAIAKLADGKCWMIENMRLADKDSSNNDIELSATNTNSPSLPLTNNYASSTTSNHLSASNAQWCTGYNEACIDQSMLYTGNTTDRGTTPATDANTYSYGNYYNWYSATAGNGKYSTSTNNSPVAGDICPTGWTLPESGDKTNMAAEKNSFYKLGLSLGLSAPANYDSQTRPSWTGSPEGSNASTAFRTYPNNFLYSGDVGSVVYFRGSYGSYWSKSAASNSGYAYSMGFDSSQVDPSTYGGEYFGLSVRCLAQ